MKKHFVKVLLFLLIAELFILAWEVISIATNETLVPLGHTIAKIEEYDVNEYYRVVPDSQEQAGFAEYQYLPCQSEGCVPVSVRYGVEKYGGCLAVLSLDAMLVDLDECGPFFDGSLP